MSGPLERDAVATVQDITQHSSDPHGVSHCRLPLSNFLSTSSCGQGTLGRLRGCPNATETESLRIMLRYGVCKANEPTVLVPVASNME